MSSITFPFVIIALSLLTGVPSRAQEIPGSSSSISTGEAPRISSNPGFEQRYPRYTVRSGDSFEISFPFSPEFNQTIIVEPDGYVTFRGTGSVHIAGETVPQLTDTIKQAYSGILRDPTVTVTLREFEKPYFIAGGQVGKPGKYDLRSDLSLVEAINIAGGFTDASKHSQVLLFRRVAGDKVEARVFDVKKMLASHNLEEDPHLMPGDMLVVPQNTISKVRRYLPTSTLGLYGNPMIP